MKLIHLAAAAGLLMAAVAAAAPLKIYGMESKPISFMHGDRPDGFAVELARAIQDRLGQHDAIEIVPWARANALTAAALKGQPAEWRRRKIDPHQLRGGARRGSIFVSLPRAQGYTVSDETNTSETAAKMLMNRRFDLWFDGEELYVDALRLAGYRAAEVEVAFRLDLVEVHFAFSKGTAPATIRAWDQALREMKRDGGFLAIYRRWLEPHQLPPDVPLSH